jgi:hypothetical protein
VLIRMCDIVVVEARILFCANYSNTTVGGDTCCKKLVSECRSSLFQRRIYTEVMEEVLLNTGRREHC